MIDSVLEPVVSGEVFVSNGLLRGHIEDLNDPAEIKVVCDNDMNALYMLELQYLLKTMKKFELNFLQVCYAISGVL